MHYCFKYLFLFLTSCLYISATGWAQQPVKTAEPVYLLTDEKAAFPGGNAAIQKYFEGKIDTKKSLKREIVTVSMVITRSGLVKDVYIGKGISSAQDSAVLKIARAMKGWQPATLKGNKVNARVLFPVIFGPAEMPVTLPKPKADQELVDIADTNAAEDKNTKGAGNEDLMVYTFVEHMPQFPGGEAALKSFVAKNLKYPQADILNKVSGQVAIQFIIEKDGTLSNFEILKTLSKTTDEEALRVIKIMPPWQPGKQNGRIVRVKRYLMFRFQPDI